MHASDELKFIFQTVNHWLNHAETKNTVLIGFSAAAIGVIGSSFNTNDLPTALKVYLSILVFFLLLSLATSLISTIPQTKFEFEWWKKKPINDGDNLYFFGDIQKYKSESYLRKICLSLGVSAGKNDAFLANQIVINSCIAMRKYEYFRLAVWFAVFGIFTPIFGGILLLLTDKN